jgi:hypothetical protein
MEGNLRNEMREDLEKSLIEKMEEFLRSSIYGVYFTVLKTNEGWSFWKISLIMIIETLQLLSLIFSSKVTIISNLNINR